MKTTYIIMDKTENTGRPYIGEQGQNCEQENQAKVYSSKKEAEEQAKAFGNWAYVQEIVAEDYKHTKIGY